MAYRTGTPAFGMRFSLTPWVKRLLIINFAVFLLMAAGFGAFIGEWFAFRPTEVLFRPWGAFTYMFVHAGFGHVFFNMLMLFFFGPPLESRWGSSGFIRYYILCGLGGAALSFIFAPSVGIVGASGALYGVMVAFAMNWPNAPIYVYAIFPVPAKWLVAAAMLVSLLGIGNGIAHMAHLGGALVGFLYLKSDWRPGAAIERWKRKSRKRSLVVVTGKKDDSEGGRSATHRRRTEDEEQLLDAVDRVLDKISAEGMSSLTDEERRLLDEMSRRRNTH